MSIADELSQNFKEKEAIEELQMRMKGNLLPSIFDDEKLTLYRFLKARDFDVDKAEKMLKKNIEWRKVQQCETILEDFKPIEVFLKYADPSVVGFDKDGDMVRYCPGGKLYPAEFMKCFTMDYFMKHWFWFAEKSVNLLKEENKKTGKKGYQCTMIFDLDELSLATVTSKLTVNMLLRLIHVYQDNYPELLKTAYVINAPSYFVIIFSIIKKVMSAAMLRKFLIFGKSSWKDKLLERIDPDVLPEFLGGNRTDPDGNPRCQTVLNQGGKIPKYHYLPENERYFKDISQVKKSVISATEKEEIQVEVDDLGTLIQWEFLVKGKDIGFGIFLNSEENQMTELIPIEKYSTADGAAKDSLKCRSTGKYVIVFDNSYSWLSAKEVQYYIKVVTPAL